MAKYKKKTNKKPKKSEDLVKIDDIIVLQEHYQHWTEDNDIRRTRKGGWNDVTDMYWGKLPANWPYLSNVVDPRARTSILEKDARLLNTKPKGKVVPRGGGADVVKSEIQNALISFQWDNANFGGTMQEKLMIGSQDTRLYGSKFFYVYWREECDQEGNISFSGNELEPLDIRDCGMDWNASHIRDAKWFQLRKWMFIEDMINDNYIAEKQGREVVWKNIEELKNSKKNKNVSNVNRRDNEYISRILSNKSLEDRVGTDKAFPMIEIVTEYREDRWISFAPSINKIVRDIKNPFKHGKIPISQLRYYPIQDDPLGESELEPVWGLWKAIQAIVCGYLDEAVLKMRPPLKIIPNLVRMETIERGPEAQWLVDRQDAIEEMRSNGEAQRWFQTTYSAMVSAFNQAMGDLSQGVSNIDTFGGEKTATEIRQVSKQQNARDQRNQNELADFIKDFIGMWISNNRQFLLSSEDANAYILDLIGQEAYERFQQMGLSDKYVPKENMKIVEDIVMNMGNQLSPEAVENMYKAGEVPAHPYIENPSANPEEMIVKSKLDVDNRQKMAKLYITEEDFNGNYDFVVDVKSMAQGSSYEFIQSRQMILNMIQNQSMLQLLAQEGVKPKVKDILISIANESGLNDSQKYFESIPNNPTGPQGQATPGIPGALPGSQPNGQNPGVPGAPEAASQASIDQLMAQP